MDVRPKSWARLTGDSSPGPQTGLFPSLFSIHPSSVSLMLPRVQCHRYMLCVCLEMCFMYKKVTIFSASVNRLTPSLEKISALWKHRPDEGQAFGILVGEEDFHS